MFFEYAQNVQTVTCKYTKPNLTEKVHLENPSVDIW